MNTTNLFSFSRIGMVIKREFIENRKSNLYRFIGFYAAFVIPLIMRMYNMSNNATWLADPEGALNHYNNATMITFLCIVGIMLIVCGAGIMENMKTKEERISFLMLPATAAEKFIARFLYVTVGVLIAVWAAVSLAEVTRLLLLPLFNVPETLHQTILPDVFLRFCDITFLRHRDYSNGGVTVGAFSVGLLSFLMWVYAIWCHSIYILGGSYWYKRPFFKTLGTLMLLSILSSVLLANFADASVMYTFGKWLQDTFSWMTINQLISFGIAFFGAFTLFNWWLSYRLFTRSQIIKPKFRLL